MSVSSETYETEFKAGGLHRGRCFGSKSWHSERHPVDWIVFNACVAILEGEYYRIVWHGDINVTKDAYKLKDIADRLDETLYVLYESSGRSGGDENLVPVSDISDATDIWNTDKPRMTQIDRYPMFEAWYRRKLDLLNPAVPSGYSAFGWRKIAEIMEHKRGINRFSHSDVPEDWRGCDSLLFTMLDYLNRKCLKRHRKRKAKSFNGYYRVKSGFEYETSKHKRCSNITYKRWSSFFSVLAFDRSPTYEKQHVYLWLEKQRHSSVLQNSEISNYDFCKFT